MSQHGGRVTGDKGQMQKFLITIQDGGDLDKAWLGSDGKGLAVRRHLNWFSPQKKIMSALFKI